MEPRSIVVTSARARYAQDISVGHVELRDDEPYDSGGNDAGPNSYELLFASLGACTSMTLARKQWSLQGAQVCLEHSKIHVEDCAAYDAEQAMLDRIDREISLTGDRSNDQRQRLLEIAERCPVRSTLVSEIECARG